MTVSYEQSCSQYFYYAKLHIILNVNEGGGILHTKLVSVIVLCQSS